MSITVRPDGSIVVETLDEAIKLSKRLAKGTAPHGTPSAEREGEAPPREQPATTHAPSDKWSTFIAMASLKPLTMAVLKEVKTRGAVGAADLLHAVGAASNLTLSGVMSGITKNAKAAGIKKRDDIIVNRREEDGTLTYEAGPLLQKAPAFDEEDDYE